MNQERKARTLNGFPQPVVNRGTLYEAADAWM